MLTKLRNFKGQSTLEYAILIVIIIGALLSIQIYIKRGVQGRLRSATDDIGDQFSPGNMSSTKTVTTTGTTSQTFRDGVTRSELLAPEVTNEDLDENVINVNQEFWGSQQDQQP